MKLILERNLFLQKGVLVKGLSHWINTVNTSLSLFISSLKIWWPWEGPGCIRSGLWSVSCYFSLLQNHHLQYLPEPLLQSTGYWKCCFDIILNLLFVAIHCGQLSLYTSLCHSFVVWIPALTYSQLLNVEFFSYQVAMKAMDMSTLSALMNCLFLFGLISIVSLSIIDAHNASVTYCPLIAS